MWPKRRRFSSTGSAFRIRPGCKQALRREHVHAGSGGVLAISGLARDAEIGERLEQPVHLHRIDVQPPRQLAAADRIRRGRQRLQRGDAVDQALVGLRVELRLHADALRELPQARIAARRRDRARWEAGTHRRHSPCRCREVAGFARTPNAATHASTGAAMLPRPAGWPQETVRCRSSRAERSRPPAPLPAQRCGGTA